MKKQKKIGKIIFNTFYWLLFLAVGAIWGVKGWLLNWRGIIGIIILVVFLVLLLEAINKKCWKEPAKEEEKQRKEPWLKIITRTAMQVTMGGAFSFGLISIIFCLIDGNNEGIVLYIGCIAVSIVLYIILLAVRPLQEQQVKDEIDKTKKDFKNYGKDERLEAIQQKAGFITLGATLMLLLSFGAVIAEYPPANYNIITVGILGIFGIAVLLFMVLHGLYNAEKLDVNKKNTAGKNLIIFIVCLIPPALLAVKWIIAGLTSIGIAFFVVFVCNAINAAFELWYVKKYPPFA
ncbi:MAG: hypothetical protein FWG91_05645 [Lachnospiraceae bacterium]|nr:hypothetical protein [Lachnospiraceae bacterium]